jgi:hypothetical protein
MFVLMQAASLLILRDGDFSAVLIEIIHNDVVNFFAERFVQGSRSYLANVEEVLERESAEPFIELQCGNHQYEEFINWIVVFRIRLI